jgi:hypothetical protein
MRAEAGCSPPDDVRGECVDWRFDTPNGTGASTSPHGDQSIVSVDSNALTAPFVGHATVHPAPWSRVPADKYGFYDSVHGGMRNVKGLTDYGRQYIQALMRHGMLVDLEHASEHTIDALIDPGTTAGHVRGPVWAFKPGPGCDVATTFNQASRSGDCWSFAYPLMSSHTSYRAQSLDPSQTTFKGFLPREFERTPDEIEYIRRSGGVVGPVVLQDPVQTIDTHVPHAAAPTWQIVDDRDWHTTSSPANDCAGSSKSWAQTYLYSLQKMGGQGVGLATDMLLVGGTSPRFGAPPGPFDLDPASIGRPYACDDSREAAGSAEDSADAQRIRALEESRDPGQYNRPAQSNTVNYAAPFTALPPGSHALRFETDPAGITKSFNERGMVVYGQLPDLLQDVSNDGVTAHDLTPLFSAAQAYVNMWDKAYVLAGCYGGDFDRCANGDEGTPLDAATVCKNTCPNDPGRGLGLAPDGTPFVLSLPPFG